MITIRQIKSDDWQAVKALRLRALADAPYAFAETLAEAEVMPDSRWQSRAQQNSEGKTSIGVLAFDGNNAVGMAVGLRDSNDNHKVRLVAMWVSADHRGSGIAEPLVDFIVNWARESGARIIVGDVTEHNPRAQAFYGKIGFELLPDRHPWEPDPTKSEIPMQMIIQKEESERGIQENQKEGK